MKRRSGSRRLALGAFVFWAVGVEMRLSAVEASSFVIDAHFQAMTAAVKSLRGEYVLEYRVPDKPSEVERCITIKEWMTTENTRIEMVGETMVDGKPKIDRKELWITTPEKAYFFDALTKAMTVSPRSAEIATTFSNPLLMKSFFAGNLFRDGGLQPQLANVVTAKYAGAINERVLVETSSDGSVVLTEKGHPANHKRYGFRFQHEGDALPSSIDAWGDRITLDEKGDFVRTPAKLAVYRVSSRSEIRIGATVLPYPKEIQWQDAEGKNTLCLIRITKLFVNEKVDPDLFVPDMTIAERIDDDTGGATPPK